MSTDTGPKPPAGDNGRWVKLGDVGVDSAALAVVDPGMHHGPDTMPIGGERRLSALLDFGVQFWCGFGDGVYDVWGWVITDPDGCERVAQVCVTLIDADDLAEWTDFGNALAAAIGVSDSSPGSSEDVS